MEIRDRIEKLPPTGARPPKAPADPAPLDPSDSFTAQTPPIKVKGAPTPEAQAPAPVAAQPKKTMTAASSSPPVLYLEEAEFANLAHFMPKAELHTHIEGAVRPETILDLAQQFDIPLPAATLEQLKEKIGMRPGENLLDFLKKFDCFRFVFERPDTLKRLAFETVEDNYRENCKYTEIRINPLKDPSKISIGEVIDATLAGMDEARQRFNVEAALIVSINRSKPVETAWDIAREAVARQDKGVVGLDLAGDEVNHPAGKFKEIFQWAKEQGLHTTLHAGEAMGPESIRAAVDECLAERIGHGVRAQEDPALVQQLKDEGVVLEMCPTSNVLLNVIPEMKQYPLVRYHHQGLETTVNTDDRGIFQITLTGENVALARETGMSLQELQELQMNAVEASFLPPERKAALRERFLADMAGFNFQVYRIAAGHTSSRPTESTPATT